MIGYITPPEIVSNINGQVNTWCKPTHARSSCSESHCNSPVLHKAHVHHAEGWCVSKASTEAHENTLCQEHLVVLGTEAQQHGSHNEAQRRQYQQDPQPPPIAKRSGNETSRYQ
jgi:hypothetical protein